MTNLRQTPLICHGHTRPVVHLAFSGITAGSYYLISASKDGLAMLRYGDTGDWIGNFQGHKGAIWSVTINEQASKAATGAADFSAKIWDTKSGSELTSLPHKHIVKSINFSTDSAHLATVSYDKLLRIWDLNKSAAVQEFTGHTQNKINQIYYFRNDTRLVSCSDDLTLRVWDITSGQEVKKIEFPYAPNSIEVSPDGQIITVVSGCSVSFWDSERLTKIKEYTFPTQINSASLHLDKTTFVCGGDDFNMYKMDYKTGDEIGSFKGHFGPIHCVRFSPDGELFTSGSEDGTIRLWQSNVGKSYGLWKSI